MNICRSKDGHVKLWYKIIDSDISQDNNAFVVFTRMLFYAHYESNFTSIRFGGKQYKLQAGEFSATIGELSALVHIPQSTLRRVLDRLEADKRISRRTDRQTTIFSICNWSKYQGDQRGKKANAWTNDMANDMANEVANDVANVTEGKKNIKNIKKRKNIDTNVSVALLPKNDTSDYKKLMDYWSQKLGRKLMDSKTSKQAYKDLVATGQTTQDLARAINGAVHFKGKQYKPQVYSFASMYAKWESLQSKMDEVNKKGAENESNRFE